MESANSGAGDSGGSLGGSRNRNEPDGRGDRAIANHGNPAKRLDSGNRDANREPRPGSCQYRPVPPERAPHLAPFNTITKF